MTKGSSGIEITVFSKAGGPLTKRISLARDGALVSDGSACVMTRGKGRRFTFYRLQEFANLIAKFGPTEAIALGALHGELADEVEIVTKDKVAQLNGAARPNIIARTGANIVYRSDAPALVLLDYDTKGMPPSVATKLTRLGGFWAALVSVLPALAGAARVTRLSTSAGISRSDTGKKLPGSSGQHVYIIASDGDDAVRFLKTLHDRCWLAGLGWMVVSSSGALLQRSIVDRMVGAPERLVFEGPPILVAPLKQDHVARRPKTVSGNDVDTVTACPPLTIVEDTRVKELKAREAQRLAPEMTKAHAAFVTERVKEIVKRTGKTELEARTAVERWCEGVLHPDIVLPFDDPDLAGKTVGDVLADPEAFADETLADPLEGVGYGRCCAKIFRRADGTPWIHSFAHGRTTYELKFDAGSVRRAMQAAAKDDVVKTFVGLAVDADLDAVERNELRQLTAQLSGTGLRVIDAAFKAARQKQDDARAKEARTRQHAERCDPRAQVPAPLPDEPWLPQIDVLEEVVGKLKARVPPVRNIDGVVAEARELPVPFTHAFTADGANVEEENKDEENP